MRTSVRLLAGVLALAAPTAALACPLCAVSPQEHAAYMFGTALLSLLPPSAVGGFVLYLRSRARDAGRP